MVDQCEVLLNVHTIQVPLDYIMVEPRTSKVALGQSREYILCSLPCESHLFLIHLPDGSRKEVVASYSCVPHSKVILIRFSDDSTLSQATLVGALNCLSFWESMSSATIHLVLQRTSY